MDQQPQQVTVESSSGVNTVLIVLVIIILLVGGYYLFIRGKGDNSESQTKDGLNINVTVPSGNNSNEGN